MAVERVILLVDWLQWWGARCGMWAHNDFRVQTATPTALHARALVDVRQ